MIDREKVARHVKAFMEQVERAAEANDRGDPAGELDALRLAAVRAANALALATAIFGAAANISPEITRFLEEVGDSEDL